MTKPTDTMQRWLGLLWLAIAGGMLNWGHLVLQPFLRGWIAVAYWITCILFALAAVVCAALDIRTVRRQVRIEHAKLARRFLREVGKPERKDRQEKAPHECSSGGSSSPPV
jgi:hypothetical protein